MPAPATTYRDYDLSARYYDQIVPYRERQDDLLIRAGFEQVEVYADFCGAPFGASYPGELVIVASRPE